MGEQKNWRDLLYPGEWAFRFFIGAALVWLVAWEWPNPIGVLVYCVLTAGVFVTAVLQVWVLVKFARTRREDEAVHQ